MEEEVMTTYAKFERRTYNGGDFRQLLKLDRDVVQYLWESPAGSFLSSIYVIPVPMIAYHLECPDYKPTVEQITESIKRLESAGWLEYDWKSSVVWLPRQLTIDKPDNKFVVQGMLKKLAELPKTYLREKCADALNQIGSATPPSTPPSTPPTTPPSTQSEAPYPNPYPDPEPEPEPEPKEKMSSAVADTPSPPGIESEVIPFEEIIDDLNDVLELTGRFRFHASTKKYRQKIHARWNERKRTLADFRLVNRVKVSEWRNDPKMRQYLNPETLYGTKFDKYLAQAGITEKEIKPTIRDLTGDRSGAMERFLKEETDGDKASDRANHQRIDRRLQPAVE